MSQEISSLEMFPRTNARSSIAWFVLAGILISTLHLDLVYYSHDTPKWLVFDIFVSLYVFLTFRQFSNIGLSLLGVLCISLLVISGASLVFAPNLFAGIEQIVRFLLCISLIYALYKSHSHENLLRLLLWASFLSALAFVLVFITERFILELPYNSGTFSPAGYINHAGQVFNIWIPCLVLFCHQKRRNLPLLITGVFTLLFITYILMSAGTRGTIIGLTLAEITIFIISLKHNPKQALLFLSVTTLLVIGIVTYQVSDDLQEGRLNQKITSMKQHGLKAAGGRVHMFENTWEMTQDNPLGVGVNNFEYIHPKYGHPGTEQTSPFINESQILRTPHNFFLKQFSELGYLGGGLTLLLFIVLTAFVFTLALKGTLVDKWLFVAFAANLFHSLVSSVFLTPASLFFSVLLIAVIYQRALDHDLFKQRFNRNYLKVAQAKRLALVFLFVPFFSLALFASELYGFNGRMTFNKQQLQTAVQLNPGNSRAYYDLATVKYRRDRDVQGSLESIENFLALYPYHISGLYLKAERQLQLKQYDAAQDTLDRLLDFYPSFDKAKRLQIAVQRRLLEQRNNNPAQFAQQ